MSDPAMEETAPRPVEAEERSETAPAPRPGRSGKKTLLLTLVALAAAAGIAFGIKTVVFYEHHVETDDAQIEAHIAPVLPKVSGFVTAVLVEDNQKVVAGQVLVRIDERDLHSKVDTARAALESAKAGVAVARSNVEAARTRSVKTAADLARYAGLRAKEEISRQQYDAAKAAAEAAAAEAQAARRGVLAAEGEVARRQADLEFAELQLSYTTVTAPAGGSVSRKSVEVGQFVQAGQPLLAIVSDADAWVVANFKETQLKKMRVGQPVEIDVDAYPGVKFHGKVDSVAAATGAKFALLPPDNATGNFTKVVQRVPVKIVFTDPPRADRPLRAGMSVNAIVSVD